jgi:hypothetical protein
MDINGNLNESNEDYEVVDLDDSNDGSDVANPDNLNESNDDHEVVNLDDSNDGSDVVNPNDFNDNSGVVNLAERRSKAVEDLEMGCRIWSYCCRLHFKEMEVALSNLHYAYVLRKQRSRCMLPLQPNRNQNTTIHHVSSITPPIPMIQKNISDKTLIVVT